MRAGVVAGDDIRAGVRRLRAPTPSAYHPVQTLLQDETTREVTSMLARHTTDGATYLFNEDGEDSPAPRAPEGADDSLEDAAEHELDDLRESLRGELGREPSEDELSDWLRRHTEGY
ncbi:MAG TPA: hypothetical protein VER32_14805 [Pyrinomonadaceae bacterium]|nr:hypothetical protein [Pyrinomonadaceae bacterium]